MAEEQAKPAAPVDRLCSEIQLFDLCDLDKCDFKKERYCTNEPLLEKFEAIREEDDRHTLLYDEHELEDGDESGFDEFDEDNEGYDED